MANYSNELQDQLSIPLLLATRVIKSAKSAGSSLLECAEIANQVESLSRMLQYLVRIAATTRSIYQPPVRRIVADVSKNLARALTLVSKCKQGGVLRQLFYSVFSITAAADFRKVSSLLESSIRDMTWLLLIFDPDGDGVYLSLSPICSNDPILSWVWSCIAAVQMGRLKDRVDAANLLASLARDSDRNIKIIVDEGGLTPLLKLLNLKEGFFSPDAQIAAADALFSIATDLQRVRVIVDLIGIPVIVSVLGDSPIRVQVSVVELVSQMAELDPIAREEFARENVTRPLISSLSSLTVLDHQKLHKDYLGGKLTESPEVKLKLKVGCAEALWKLCKGCLLNCRQVTETKGLICLAKMIEKEMGDLQFNCLMTVMEIAAVAESNPDLRRTAFRRNSPVAKAVFDQLLRLIQEETTTSNWKLKIPAIIAIGSLARTFLASQTTMVVGPLVVQIGSENVDVGTEAVIALGKFVCVENFNRVEHSKTVIEFDGVGSVMSLLQTLNQVKMNGLTAHLHCLELVCYLALNVGSSKAFKQAKVFEHS